MFYDPLLRPIISQIGTVTYLTAKWLNSMITKYMNKRYMIESTYEFITISKFIENPETVASLDVESLFTNIPVNETTEIIVHEVYDHRICQGNHLKTSVQQKRRSGHQKVIYTNRSTVLVWELLWSQL